MGRPPLIIVYPWLKSQQLSSTSAISHSPNNPPGNRMRPYNHRILRPCSQNTRLPGGVTLPSNGSSSASPTQPKSDPPPLCRPSLLSGHSFQLLVSLEDSGILFALPTPSRTLYTCLALQTALSGPDGRPFLTRIECVTITASSITTQTTKLLHPLLLSTHRHGLQYLFLIVL